MGKLSLLFVIAALVTTSFMIFNTGNSTLRAEQQVWDHQQNVLARDAASTGLSTTIQKLAQSLNTPWSNLDLEQTDISYADTGGTYTIETESNGECSVISATRLASIMTTYTGSELIEVRSTGKFGNQEDADERHSHQLVACYIQADWSDPMPPAFQYSFMSNQSFTFNGGPDIKSIAGEGNVHSNNTMDLGPQVVIEGHATMSMEEGSSTKQNTTVSSFEYGPSVPMVEFDPEEFRTDFGLPASGSNSEITPTYRYDSGDLTLGGNSLTEIGASPMPEDMGSSSPYVWFIDGNLSIDADLQLPGYTIIVATGTVNFSGNANATVTGTTPPNNATDEQLEQWVESQLIDGHPPLAWYANGDVGINGTPNVVGNFYTNGDFTLDGGGNGGNLVGSIAAYGEITANGGGNGNNFWFVEVGEQNVIPGVLLPGKQIVRIGFAEWTDSLLKNDQ